MADPKDAPPATPESSKTKISLDKATREELVEFVKKQNVHTKKLETKYAELASQFRTQAASLKSAEKQVAVQYSRQTYSYVQRSLRCVCVQELKGALSDPQEITRLREAESRAH